MTKSFFEECILDIEFTYEELGHQLGWRFLSVPKSIFNTPVKVALITLNPGGNKIPEDHPSASCESGVSYLVEKWGTSPPGGHKLQKQVKHLFRELCTALDFKGSYEDLMRESLIAHFIPFRSPRIEDLHNKRQSIQFGLKLWGKILSTLKPKLIICLGRDVYGNAQSLIESELSGKIHKDEDFPTGWGEYKAKLKIYKITNGEIRLLYLPHLSTFQLFNRESGKSEMQTIIRSATKGI